MLIPELWYFNGISIFFAGQCPGEGDGGYCLKVKAEAEEVWRREAEISQAALKAHKEAQLIEDMRMKELVNDIRDKNVRATSELQHIRAEVERLNKELAAMPSEADIIRAFRSHPSYYKELNDKAAEKIFTTRNVASKFLADYPGGQFEKFIPFYMDEEERLLAEARAARGNAPESTPNSEAPAPDSTISTQPAGDVPAPPPDSEYVV